MKKNGKRLTKTLFLIVSLISLFCTVTSCNSWMSDDGFYEDIESEVKYANASEINVFVRYASTEMGNTSPEGFVKFKQDIEAEISATTTDNYGFYKWAAFSTSFLQTDVQNSDFVFESDEDYAAKYAPNELPDSVVYFADRKSPKTTIKVLEQRPDIFIIPVVVVRPTVSLTIPGNGAGSVIRNMTIRINFSKPMDRDSFFNEQGICDKITITQGTQSFNADGTIEVTSEDITEKFDTDSIKIKPEEGQGAISTNGKMLTLKFKPNGENEAPNGFTAQSYVNIKISDDIKDIYGYTMGSPGKDKTYTLSFQAGAYFDTLAPRISELSAGIGSDFTGFVGLYENSGTVQSLGSFTTFPVLLNSNNVAIGAPEVLPNFLEDVTEDYYKAELLNQRVQNSVNIRILAEDISGSGSGQSQMGVESDVRQIFVKANRVVDLNGEPVPNDESNRIMQKTIAYSAQGIESTVFAGKKYSDLIDSTNAKYSMSLNKSKGFLFDYDLSSLGDGLIRIDIAAADSVGNSGFGSGGQYSSEYGNGYATIFVVKDTTCPDAASFANTISSQSTKAVYGWYNEESYDDIKLIGTSITDIGHLKLRSDYNKLKWAFVINGDSSWKPSVGDFSVFIKDGYQLNISPESKPQEDGPFVLTYAVVDDIGNISDIARVDSIIYDNTKPTINEGVAWINSSGEQVRNTSKERSTGEEVYLKIPFTEKTSGVRRVTVSVTELTTDSFDEANFFYNTESNSVGDIINIVADPFVTEEKTKAFEKEYKTDEREQDYIYINKIKIGENDGLYHINVALTDQALNVSDVCAVTFSRDTTLPDISNLVVYDNSDTSENHDSIKHNNGNWLQGNTEKTILFSLKDTGSGVETIIVEGAEITDSSELLINNEVINKTDADGNTVFSVNGNSITFADYTNPIIQGENVFSIKITNVTLSSAEADSNSKVKVTVRDFANSGDADVTYNIMWDSTPTKVEGAITIYNETTTSTQYTNTRDVKLKLTVPVDASGIVKLMLTNAVFTNTNTDTIMLTNPNTLSETVFDIKLTDAGDGSKSIKVKTEDLVGNTSEETESNVIICDETNPSIGGLEWLVDEGSTDVPGAINSNIINQTLLIPITEPIAGIKKLTLNLIKDGETVIYGSPFTYTSLLITDDSNTPINAYQISADGKTIIFTNPITSVNTPSIKIKNIKLADTNVEGTYKVYVKVVDAAENIDTTTNTIDGSTTKCISIANDTTRPKITKISIPGLQKIVDFTDSGNVKYYISKDNSSITYLSESVFETRVTLTVEEKSSGVNKIILKGNSLFANNINLKYKNTEIEKSKYTVDKNTPEQIIISITDANDSFRDSENEFDIEISGVAFNNNEHNIEVILADVAKNESSNTESPVSTNKITSGSLSNISTFWSDYEPIIVDYVTGYNNFIIDNNDIPYKAEQGYTNSEYVDCNAKLTLENKMSSGINKIVFTNATIDTNTEIKYVCNNVEYIIYSSANTNNCEITNNNTLIFKDNKAITKDGSIKIKNLKLDNSSNGEKEVKVTYHIASNITSVTVSEKIILDTIEPAWTAETNDANAPKGVCVYSTNNSDVVYPKPINGSNVYGLKINTLTNGENPVLYFYAKSDINIAGSATDAGGLKEKYVYLKKSTDTEYKQMSNIFQNFSAENVFYTMIAVDKAGNKSTEVKFFIIKDDESPDSDLIKELVTVTEPTNARLFRDVTNGKNIVRKTTGNESYKITINLAGIEATSGKTLLEGSAAAVKGAVSEIIPTNTASPIYEYAVYAGADTNCKSFHKYVKNSSSYEGNSFKSSVDASGNIVIIVPNTSTNGVVKLALRDGCGNTQKGILVSNTGNGIDWVVDTKLGSVDVDENGKAVERSILMNPGVEYNTDSPSDYCDTFIAGVKFGWKSQSSPSSDKSPQGNGESRTGTLVKDTVKHITYYNDNAWFGGALGFKGANGVDKESVNEGTAGKIEGSNPSVYSMRIKLCCVPKNDPDPDQDYFTSHTANGQSTEWIYSNGGNDRPVFFLQYPHPDYDALGWGSTTEYKIYYLVEDYVGNYDINTVVNSTAETGSDAMVYWLYDNTPPVVTVGTTGKTPDDTSLSINELVPNNNGYQAYQYGTGTGGTRNVAIAWNKTKRDGATINDTQREGTTRKVLGDPGNDYRYNCPFFDIKVTDNTGIRAFAYSKIEAVPAYTFSGAQQGEGTWFAGTSGDSSYFGMNEVIGNSATYTGYTNYNKYDAGSDYNGKYSGTPVCSVFPNDYDNTPIYLHVMDWVGNVQTYRMGNNITWKKDNDAPKNNTTQFEEFAEQYYINSKDGILEFAGKKVNGQTTAKVYLPSGFYTDSGTAIFGWSLEMNNVATVDTDENGSYIQFDLSKYGETPILEDVYIYDSVGNCLQNSYNVKIDSTAPVYDLLVRAHDSSDAKTHNVYIKGQGYGTDLDSAYNKQLKGEDGKTKIYSNLVTSESAIQERSYYVYVSDPKICFIAKTDELASEDSEGKVLESSVKYEILKWNGTSWVTKESETGNRTMGSRNSFYFETLNVSSPKITVNNTDSGYYCIALSDRAGNSNYAYVYAKQDNKAPTVEAICTNVNTINGINYYGPKGKVQYKITAEDSGIYEYGTASPYIQPTNTTTVTEDYIGNTGLAKTYIVHAISNTRVSKDVELSYGGYSKWTYIDTTPTCGYINQNQQYVYNTYYTPSNKEISNVTVTRDSTSGYSSLTISKTNTSGNLTLSTVTATGISSFSFKPNNFISNNSHPSAWKVFEGTLSSLPTKPDFVSWSEKTISDTDTYTFVSSNWTNKVYYFYPIDMAGNVGNPIAFSFETPVTPNVSAETHTGIYKNTSTNVTYFNKSSELKIKVTNPNSSKAIKITSYSISKKNTDNTFTTLKAEQFNEQNYINITPNSNEIITVLLDATDFESLNSENLYVQVQTEFTASDEKSFGKFCYDNTPPAISLSSVLCNSQAAGYGYQEGNSVIYGNNTSTVQLTLSATETGSGLKGYALSENPATWSTDSITINRGATGFESSYTIYAKDNLGNVGSQAITFTLDSTTPNPPLYSVKNESDLQYVHFVSNENKLYISKDSIELRATSAATNVYTYKCNTQTSQSGEFTINTAGTYYFCVVNNVGNESNQSVLYIVKDTVAPATPTGTFTFYKDSTQAIEGFKIDTINNKVLFNPNLVNKAVFTPSAQTDDAATSGDGVGSGIAGYSNSGTATDWADTVTFDLSSSDSNASKEVYVKDNVGNVCTSSLSYSFTADSTGPAPASGVTINENPDYSTFDSANKPTFKAINLPSDAFTVTTAQDDIVGGGYITVMLNSGTKFTLALADSDCVGYGFTYGVTASALVAPTFTSVTPNDDNKIEVTLPNNVVGPHYFIFLWLKDSLGNVSTYNVMHNSHGWFLSKPTGSVSVTYSVSNGILTIEGLQQVPISTVDIYGTNLNDCSKLITFDYNIDANYCSSKSYEVTYDKKGNAGGGIQLYTSGAPYLTGSGKITINVGNDATVSSIIINGDTTNIICSSPATTSSSPATKFIKAVSSSVRSIFTPKTKKIYLSSEVETKTIEKDTGVISQNNQPSLTKTASPKKNNKPKVRKANNSNKVLDSSVVKNTVTQKKNNVIPEDAKVLEVSPIEPSVNASVITSEVINNSGVETTVEKTDVIVSKHKQNSILVYSIIALVMCAVIAMVVIVNKIIIDKTK